MCTAAIDSHSALVEEREGEGEGKGVREGEGEREGEGVREGEGEREGEGVRKKLQSLERTLNNIISHAVHLF